MLPDGHQESESEGVIVLAKSKCSMECGGSGAAAIVGC